MLEMAVTPTMSGTFKMGEGVTPRRITHCDKRVNYVGIENINPQIIKSRGKEQPFFTRECCNSILLKTFTSNIV